MHRSHSLLLTLTALSVVFTSTHLVAQRESNSAPSPLAFRQTTPDQTAPRRELPEEWQAWLDEDVVYIITEKEKHAFMHLKTDDERWKFVEQFWLDRNPAPAMQRNQYKEEHYRRIGYANSNFGSRFPGWQTDRGMTYIRYGPPDQIVAHPSGQPGLPSEIWTYQQLAGVGAMSVQFNESEISGEFEMAPADSRQMKPPSVVFKTGNFVRPPQPTTGIETYRLGLRKPFVGFEDLAAATETFRWLRSLANAIATSGNTETRRMQARADYVRLTGATTLVSLTIQISNEDLRYKSENGHQASIKLYGRLRRL